MATMSLSCPRAGRQRFAGARAEDEQRWTARRGRANPDGHRQKGGRPGAALSLGRKRPRRAYTGVNPHRSNVMLRCNNCKHISTFCSLADRARRAIGRHCAARAIRRLRSSRGFLDHARAFEALHVPGDHRNEAATLRARDRASLKVLATEARFFRLSSSAMSFSWKKDMGFPRSSSIRTPGRRSSIWALTNSSAAAANRAHSRVSLTAVPDTTTKPFTAPCLLFGEHSTGHDARASRVKPSQNAN